MRVLGLDEAGRGCVLGPLVVGGYCCEVDGLSALRAAGAADSKQLTHARRVSIREALRPLGESAVVEVSPAEIDAGNINTLEERAFAELITRFRPDAVTIDAPVHPRGIPAFEARLRRSLDYAPTMVIEPKADDTYAEVGAASIFAKVHRDALIAEIDVTLGPVGSGYPSDPVTRAWLAGFLKRDEPFPPCVRTRWGTIEGLRQQTLF